MIGVLRSTSEGRTSQVDPKIRQAIFDQVAREPFAEMFGLELVELNPGYSRVQMTVTSEMENLFRLAHGGAIFALIDEAFETASNSHGTVAVALSMTINHVAPASPGNRLTAEAREVNRTLRTSLYDIRVYEEGGGLIATCQAVAYRKGNRPAVHPGRFLSFSTPASTEASSSAR